MKKKYIKPELFFENYELSQNIASACTIELNNTDHNNCSGDFYTSENKQNGFGLNLFVNKGMCTITTNLNRLNQTGGVCYTNSIGTYVISGS